MLQFVCPKCHARLRVPAQRVPVAGAWASCPKCRERFFLKSAAFQPEALPAPSSPSVRRTGRQAEEQRLLDRLRAQRGASPTLSVDGPDGWAVTVFPQRAPNFRLYGLAVGLTVAVGVGLLAFFFSQARLSPLPASADSFPPESAPPAYQDAGLAADLAGLRRDLIRRGVANRHIEYSGRESRLFKHLMASLAPSGVCRELGSLTIRSAQTRAGFRAVGQCLDGRGQTPELSVGWADGVARVTMAGAAGRLDIPLRPAAARAKGAADHD